MKRGPEFDVAIPENLTLADFYLGDNVAFGRGGKIAAYYGDETYTFDQLCALTNRVGNLLKRLAVGSADRVMLILRDSPEWLAGWFATMKIGAVATHIHTYLPPSDYGYFISYVRPKVIIADAATLGDVRNGVALAGRPVTLVVAGDDVGGLKAGEYGFGDMVGEASPVLEDGPATKDSTAFWNFSGGTTGKPKGVPHSHDHGVIGFESFQRAVHYAPEDIVLRVPKLFFHYARDIGMNWPLRAGAAVCLSAARTTPDLIFELIAKYRPTILVNVPTMMRSMLGSPAARTADLSGIRLCISSGELLSEQLYGEFKETFGVEVVNAHGSAETNLGFFVTPPGAGRPGSSGKVAPLVAVKLVDGEKNEVSPGESGVLWVRSGAAGRCYHGDREKTEATFLGDDWVNTNDLFREDEDGYFWYMGRADDLIKVSGVYVAPLEIEKCLEGHEAVRACAVLGVKDADGLTKTMAFVVLADGFEPSDRTAADLNLFCGRKLAKFKVPKRFAFVAELPETGQGKIDRRQLSAAGSTAPGAGAGHAFTAV